MGAHRRSWELMGAHGRSWEIMGDHGSSWELMGAHGSSWELMGAHGSSWEIMGARPRASAVERWGRAHRQCAAAPAAAAAARGRQRRGAAASCEGRWQLRDSVRQLLELGRLRLLIWLEPLPQVRVAHPQRAVGEQHANAAAAVKSDGIAHTSVEGQRKAMEGHGSFSHLWNPTALPTRERRSPVGMVSHTRTREPSSHPLRRGSAEWK